MFDFKPTPSCKRIIDLLTVAVALLVMYIVLSTRLYALESELNAIKKENAIVINKLDNLNVATTATLDVLKELIRITKPN